jgi:long-chain acyl-CoA synthetase
MIEQSGPGKSVLAILPIFHGFGLGVCIHTCLGCGMKVILIPQFNPKEFGSVLHKTKANIVCAVPSLYESLTTTKLGKNDLEYLECAISGGDFMSYDLKNRVDKYFKEHGSSAEVRVGYGLTEGSGAVCLSPENSFADSIIGAPLPDIDFKIVKNDTFKAQPVGEEGEICISGPLVMMGYLGDDAETAQTLRLHEDGKIWLHTGDLGRLGDDGLVYFAQRLKRMIISSGYNIYPTHLESIINSHEAVLTSTVIGIDHPYKGQVPKAFIVLKTGYKPSKRLEKEIRELLERNVPVYALPTAYEFRDKLPQTLVGKVAFKKLEAEEKSKK